MQRANLSDKLYFSVVNICAAVAGLVFIAALIFGGGSDQSQADNQNANLSETVVCKAHLKQIGIALRQYHEANGAFPPAYVADENGEPMHSWRVLLLPFLEEKALYEEYDLDEPWNGPNNSKLAPKVPAAYRCPGDPSDANTTTSYVAVVGTRTAWRGTESIGLDDIKDIPEKTILIVEATNQRVEWMAPEDLQYDRMGLTFNAEKDHQLSSPHGDGAHVLMVNGEVELLAGNIEKGTLRQLLEIKDGLPKPPKKEGDEKSEKGGDKASEETKSGNDEPKSEKRSTKSETNPNDE